MNISHPIRRLVFCCALVALVVGVLLVTHDDSRRLTDAEVSAAMKPLWVDEYVPLGKGVPPWPRGISAEQAAILERAQSVVIATIDPYRSDGPHFHGHEVLGARVHSDPDQAREIVGQIIDGFHPEGWAADEFYPQFVARVTAQDDRGNSEAVDLLIAPHYRGMLILTPNEIRFCVIDEDARPSVYAFFEGLPRKYDFE